VRMAMRRRELPPRREAAPNNELSSAMQALRKGTMRGLVRFPGEKTAQWSPEMGRHGVALVELDQEFCKQVIGKARAGGLQISINTDHGTLSVTGDIAEWVVRAIIRSYIETARESLL
jgi:hypothetical protein